MTQPAANCPNCGAKITFHWSGSVQTVCEYCKSILVRTDLDLHKVGQIADLPSNSSPIQIGTEGAYGPHAFVAIGRIIYEYEQGNWNEWHLMMNDGTSGWLSDAQDEYAITFAAPGRKLPKECRIGQEYTWDKQNYTVSTITKAHYRGVEGELPFQYWDKSEVILVDLTSHTGNCATIDYSDDPPILYLGKAVEFETLQLKNLRSFGGWS
jgi:Domain of unknown function (DUF4178)